MSSRAERIGRRVALIAVITAVISALAYGAGWAYRSSDTAPAAGATDPGTQRGAANERDRNGGPGERKGPRASDTATPGEQGSPDADATDDDSASPSDSPTPRSKKTKAPELVAGPALYQAGDEGDEVREIQARLRQIDWFNQDVTGYFGDVTVEAIRGFQAKRGFPVTGEVDQRTLDRLEEMTTEPTDAELTNQLGGNVPGALDARCQTGRVLCIDKSSNTLRWVVDGAVQTTVDVRFGSSTTPTREGQFSVDWKSRDHVSSLYDTAMPYAMFFSGGQAVHYSSDFAANGYNGASHGCVNVRDEGAIAALFDQVQVGDTVIVYWS